MGFFRIFSIGIISENLPSSRDSSWNFLNGSSRCLSMDSFRKSCFQNSFKGSLETPLGISSEIFTSKVSLGYFSRKFTRHLQEIFLHGFLWKNFHEFPQMVLHWFFKFLLDSFMNASIFFWKIFHGYFHKYFSKKLWKKESS